MKANKYISIKEHKLLVVVAFIAFIFVSIAFYLNIIKNYNYSVYREQQTLGYSANYNRTGGFPYPSQTVVPLFHFLTLFIFLALLKTRKFLLPLFLTVFYAAVFIYGLSVSYYEGMLG